MRTRRFLPSLTCTAAALVLAACGGESTFDPNNREVAWTYTPTHGTALPEHLTATGAKGDKIAKGWSLRLHDGKRLSIKPFELAEEHELFGKVTLLINLYDSSGERIGIVRTEPITAENAAFSFDLEEAKAKRLHDVVITFKNG
ncbi:MAG: hypothetical protein NXI31_21810 [bacterium]|nr:hypothetical protein [bacterium]